MLVRVYRSELYGKEFLVRHDLETNTLVCTCKEFQSGRGLHLAPGLGWVSRCRHTRKYLQESAAWDPNPLASLDWL